MAVIEWILTNGAAIKAIALAVSGLATLVTGLTPTRKDDDILARVQEFVGRLGIATHKDAPGTFKLPGAKASPLFYRHARG